MPKTRSELTKKLQALEEKAQRGEDKAIAKQHAEGKLTARERIEKLLDGGTFVEEFMLAETPSVDFGMAERKQPTDGVITGYGKIDGRTVYVFAQDFTVIAGTVGAAHAEKIAYCIETARKVGVPVIGLYDSAGARIQEGLDVTRAIGKIFFQNSITSGTVPQISAIMGPCIGVAAYSVQEAADMLGVNYFSVYRLIQRGKLRVCRALRGKLLVPRTELLKLLKTE